MSEQQWKLVPAAVAPAVMEKFYMDWDGRTETMWHDLMRAVDAATPQPPALGGDCPHVERYTFDDASNGHGYMWLFDESGKTIDYGGGVYVLASAYDDQCTNVARLRAEVERLSDGVRWKAVADEQMKVIDKHKARNAELEGLLRKQAEHIATLADNTLSYSSGIGSLLKTKEVNDAAYAALAHQQVVNAALAEGKEHE